MIIFTGKYVNINFKMKIAYPTLPCEYVSTIPNIEQDGGISMQNKKPQQIPHDDRGQHSHLQSRAM